MDVYRVIYKKSIRKTRVRDVRRTAFASARWERQTGARGVPEPIARAFGEVVLTLSATSRQLSEACETPAVRRECAKTENAAEGVKACVTPKLVWSVRLCRNVTQVPIMDALRRQSNAS